MLVLLVSWTAVQFKLVGHLVFIDIYDKLNARVVHNELFVIEFVAQAYSNSGNLNNHYEIIIFN